MNRVSLGVNLAPLGLPLRRAVAEAARLGVPGVQLDAVGDLSPGGLSQTGRREVRHLLRSHNLELTALGCPLRRGLDAAEDQQPRLEHVRRVMGLAFDLGPRRVIVQAGRIPPADDLTRAALLREALTTLGAHGDRTGTALALETGLDSGAALRDLLAAFDTAGLGVNYDPGNLVMHGHDPYQAARDLGRRVVHAHAKDARAATASRAAQEVPLGHGDIDWTQLLGVLEEIDYRGWLVVERETGADQLADLAGGVAFLRRLVG
jgi:sugar phosphate isomerase/epimerase